MPYPKRKEEQVRWWLEHIAASRKVIKPHFDACKVLEKQYFNEPSTAREENENSGNTSTEEHARRTRSGIIYGWIDQSLANMLDRDPVFQLFPENRDAAEKIGQDGANNLTRAQGNAKIVNHRYRTTNQLRVDERCARDAFVFPYGVAKIGYEVDFDLRGQEILQDATELDFDEPAEENLFLMTGRAVLVKEEHDHAAHIESHVGMLQSAEFLSMGEDFARVAEDIIEEHIKLHKMFSKRINPATNVNVQREQPYAIRWKPDMFLTSAFAPEGLQDARWIAFQWELPLEEVEANPNWRVKDVDDITTFRPEWAPEHIGGKKFDGFDMVRGWEIWAKNFAAGRNDFRDMLLVVSEDNEDFLRDEDEWPYDRLEDYPAATVAYQPGMDHWFHRPPLIMGGGTSVQSLINEVLDSTLSTIRKQKNIWLYDDDVIDGDTLTAILEAPDNTAIGVSGLSQLSGDRAIMPLPLLNIPPEKSELVAILQNIFDRSVGTPQPVQLPKTETATQASILEKRNSSRENKRSALLSEFQIDKAKKMWQLDAQFLPEDLILLDRHAHAFLTMDEEVVKGEYFFTMDVTSHATAISVERSQWMDLLNLFAGLTPIMMETFQLPPNLPEIARRLLVRGFDERATEEILPMLEQASQQLQSQGAIGPNGAGNGQVTGGPGAATGMANPAAEAANQAVGAGRGVDRAIGPLARDNFNRDIPNEGRQEGEAARG